MSIAEPLAVPQGSAAADQQRGRAQLLLRQGKRTEAAACLQAAIKTGPGHAGDHRQLATVLTALGRFDEAQHHLERAVALRPRDAAILHDLGNLLRRQGRLDLAEGRYREALGQRPDDADTWNSLGITLLSQARPAEAADCFRRALRANAKHPQAQNNLGVALADQGKMVEAAAIYRQVLRERPDSPETQNNLGVALAAQGEYGQAIEWYGKALQLRPTYAEARNNLGNALRQDGRLEDAAASLKEALRLKPQYAEAHNNLAVVRVKQGRLEQGISGYSEAVRLKPNYAEAHLNRAMAWLMMGEWDQGWQAYEWRLQMKDFALRPLPPPRWIGEALDGRALLLRSEQGLGDVLQFVRYAPLVRQRGGTVVLECPARLIPLLQRCPGIDRLVPQGKPVPDCAYQVPLLNLPTIFRTTLETVPAAVPYLSADPERVERWRGRISGEGLRIGIAWQGSPRYVGDRHRSIALKHFEPLARLPGAQLYSLQMGHGSEQLKAVGQRWGVVDLAAQGLDKDGAFVDSAAVLQHLDLLVCSDSALAHLAGALGVPVWMAVGAAPDWRWLLHREDSPWYPSMRLFRQRQWGDWDEVFARIAQDVSVLQASAEAGMTRLGHAEQAGHLRQRGLACIKEGRLEEGIAALRLALQFDSSFAPAHNNLGVALAQLGRHDEAADCYRAALRLRPDYAEAHNNLGDLLQRQGRREEALECFRRAIEHDARSAQAHFNLGIVLAESGESDAAIGAYQQAADYRPDWANPYRHWALALESQGKLAEAEAKYRQALERTGDSADGLHQTGMRCLEQGRVVEAMACQRAALAVQPAHGEARYELGKMLAQRRNLKEAEVHLREAVRLLPRHADAWHRLGNVLRHQKRFAEAEPYYREAIRLNPTATDVYNHLGIDLLDQGRPEQAEAQFREGLRLRPDFSEAANNLGVSLEQQGRLDEALAAYQESLRHKPDAADTHKNLALAWLLTGNFEQGWPEYEWRWKTREAVVRPFPQPRWDGKPLAGEPVLLHAEQGLGDVLQFVRYAPLVRQRGGTVVLECPARLIPLLQRCPGIDRLVPQGKPAPDCAYQVPLLSLPTIFRTTLETVPAAVPYLSADPERVERWRERISGEGLRIGIAWQGSPRYVGDRHRSIALKHFEPLAQLPGVRLFSLQIGHGSEQLKAVCQRWGVVDLATAGLDKDGAFVDSAAVLQHLDLLVCSDSALAHLAGALGVPVWMALPRARDWRWLLDREDSPWYPTMRLFRQRRWGDWDEVFTRIAQQLSTLPHGVRVGRPLTVPVDLGDFFDQLAASQARVQQAKASDQLASSQIRLGALLAVQARCIRPSAELTRLAADLRAVHSSLWQIKQSMHGYERHGDFGPQFTELARELCRQQGVREKLKQAIQRLSAGERVSVSGGQRT